MDERDREAIRAEMARRLREAEEHPERARERLIREGFYTPDGKLTPEYGGPK